MPSRHDSMPSTGRLSRLALKELRETLRDRRTLITLVLMPLLVYPLLGVILQKALLSTLSETEETAYQIGFCSASDARHFETLFQAKGSEVPVELLYNDGECDPERLIQEIGVDLAVRIDVSHDNLTQGSDRPRIEFFYLKNDPRSQKLVLLVQERLRLALDPVPPAGGENRPIPPGAIPQVVVSPVTLPPEDSPQFSLATFVPLMLILMTVTGAVYPAIDLTAGERERGTLEVLVAAPVPRMALLSAKFVAVVSVAMLTAIVNLAAMLITLYASGLEALVFADGRMSWSVMGQIFALLMLFAGFFSAVLLAITSFAKSFKEAQAYLIPLMLVSLAPGVFSLTPGLKMNGMLAVVPLVNIVLLGRDLLQGQMVPLLFAGAVVSTILYAVLALFLAARVFGSDAILYGSQGSLKDLFQRPENVRPVPTLTQLAFALAVLFPSFLILGSLPGRLSGLPMLDRLGISAAITVALFFGWPLIMTWRNAIAFRSAFRIPGPSGWSFLVAVLWGLTLWIWAYEIEVLTLAKSRLGALRDVFDAIKSDLDKVPLAGRLMALAVVPAVCEEWFFRGYLLSGLEARVSKFQAVVLSAGLFGLFHVIVRDLLFFERFLPSAMMGLMLGWLAVRSGSVWPGMLLHGLHNSLLLSIEAHQEPLKSWGLGLESRTHFPLPWLAGSAFVVAVGVFVLLKFVSGNSLVATGNQAESSSS